MRAGRILVAALTIGACIGAENVFPAPDQLPVNLNILFDDNCDGMNLRLNGRGGAIGRHTGCNAGEFLNGQQFSANGETGVTVQFFERASGMFVRFDIYRTGFRAGRFYVYEPVTNTLVRYSTFRPAP